MRVISHISIVPWNVPMRSPYRSAQRLTTVAHNVLVRVTLTDGTQGFGESAPATYVTGETQDSVVALLQGIAPGLINRPIEEATAILADMSDLSPGANGAMEMALFDVLAREHSKPFYTVFTQDSANRQLAYRTDISLPLLPPLEAAERATTSFHQGFTAFKIKVGSGDPVADEARVRAVAGIAPTAKLRIDGNQGFSAESAIAFAERLADLYPRLELFEQPTRAGDDASMREVQRNISLPVFADESVHRAEDARRLLENGVCQGVVLKIAKSGILQTLEIGRTVHRSGGTCLFGCMMETRLGITAALHLAVALGPDIVPLLDLDGHLLVADEEWVFGGFHQEADLLRLDTAMSGLGINVLV